MRIYTKTGDSGETSLLGGKRVKKSCIEMEVIGEIDELNASIGVLVCELEPEFTETIQKLQAVQHQLFAIGAQLAAVQTDLATQIPQTSNQDVVMLEEWIDAMDRELEVLTQFILPGGDRAAAQSFLARAVCRRAERFLVSMQDRYELNVYILHYINRLSDVLFTLGRYINMKSGKADMVWVKEHI